MQRLISYIGSKVKLYDFLEEVVFSQFDKEEKKIFCDMFAGTNSVSYYAKKHTKWDIITNDFTKYSYILSFYLHFDKLESQILDKIKIKLIELDNLKLIENGDIFNEFSANGIPKTISKHKIKEIFSNQPYNSRMFFSEKTGKKIDTIKNKIKEWYINNEITELEKNIFMIFLISYADKSSNTTSVYGAYLKNTKKMEIEHPFLDDKLMKEITPPLSTNSNNKLISLNMDILKAINYISKQKYNINDMIIYMDPPYSTRSYEGNYHILEYISDFNFSYKELKRNSKTGQREKKFKNPFVSKVKTYNIFYEMIENSLKISNNLFISYSTDGLIKQEDIEEIYNDLKEKYKDLILNTNKKEYKRFKSSTTPELKKLQTRKNELLNKNNIDTKEEFELLDIKNKLNKNKENKVENTLNEIIWHFKKGN